MQERFKVGFKQFHGKNSNHISGKLGRSDCGEKCAACRNGAG